MEYFDDLNFNLGINIDLDFSLDDKIDPIQKPEQQHGNNAMKFNSFFENFYKVPMELGLGFV